MTGFEELLRRLQAAKAEFVVVGGVAATIHGSSRLTQDIDLVYSRTPANLQRMVDAFAPLDPYLRGAPPGLPFRLDVETLKRGLNFTLQTNAGAVDLLAEIAGGGTFGSLVNSALSVDLFGSTVLVVDLPTLIELKRAAGRPKDLEVIAELEALSEEAGGD